MITTTVSFAPVTKHSRCGNRGKHIMCPNCTSITKVYHLSWSAIVCQQCDKAIDKLHWSIEQ